MPEWQIRAPKRDNQYFERMSRAVFQAGLSWRMIENKWKNFQNSFNGFSIQETAKLKKRDVRRLMKDEGIVRNEKKIRATIFNAQESLRVKKEFGSLRQYLESFGKDHDRLIVDLQKRFRHLGPSSARVFLYMSGVKLKPTKEELQWHKKAKNRG